MPRYYIVAYCVKFPPNNGSCPSSSTVEEILALEQCSYPEIRLDNRKHFLRDRVSVLCFSSCRVLRLYLGRMRILQPLVFAYDNPKIRWFAGNIYVWVDQHSIICSALVSWWSFPSSQNVLSKLNVVLDFGVVSVNCLEKYLKSSVLAVIGSLSFLCSNLDLKFGVIIGITYAFPLIINSLHSFISPGSVNTNHRRCMMRWWRYSSGNIFSTRSHEKLTAYVLFSIYALFNPGLLRASLAYSVACSTDQVFRSLSEGSHMHLANKGYKRLNVSRIVIS